MTSSPVRFRLSRWFGGLALLLITGIGAASVSLLGWFVTERMLWQEGVLTRDFVHSLILVEQPLQAFFASPGEGVPPQAEASLAHFSRMPDVLRTNVYGPDRTLIWSSDATLIGRRFGPNDELDLALTGAVVVEHKTKAQREVGKTEYVSLAQPEDLFVEIYVPVTDATGSRVLGAIEFYKNPRGLMGILAQLRQYLWVGALGFGALMFAVLFGLVRRADGIMRDQEQRLVRQETFAVLGEMSSAVAHAIRNPLAAIRSSAELILETTSDRASAEPARDIVAQSDRLSAWLRQWLTDTQPTAQPALLALAPLVEACLQAVARDLQRRGIEASLSLPSDLPTVRADERAVEQVLHSVLSNAMEAVSQGGRIALAADRSGDGRRVTLKLSDDGPGMTEAERARVGEPFFTTKPQGLGVGLALARRLLERQGGQLRIDSAPGRGTVVSISLLVA
jgi:signal transduction histidine kinase